MSSEVKSLKNVNNDASKSILEGKIIKTTFKIAFPIFISQVLVFAYIIVDTFFISLINKQSTELLSGVGLIIPIYTIFYNLATGLFLGMSSLVSRGIGNKSKDVIDKAGMSGLVLGIIISIITVILSVLFGRQFVNFLAGNKLDAQTIKYGMDYFYSLLPYMVLLLTFNLLGGILQGEGMAMQYSIALVFSIVINIILNPIFIFIFKLGVKGSGISSSLSIAIAIIYFVILFLKKKSKVNIKFSSKNLSNKMLLEILRIAIPSSIGLILINISTMILNNLVGSISLIYMNSWVLVSRLDQFFLIPAYAIGLASIPMIGQNFGHGNMERADKIYKTNLVLCLIISGVLAILYILLSQEIVKYFTSVPQVIDASVRQIKLLAFTSVGICAITVVGCCFQAAGKPIPNLVNNIIRALIIASPLVIQAAHFIAKQSINVIFFSVGAGNIIGAIIAIVWGGFYFRSLKFKSKAVQI